MKKLPKRRRAICKVCGGKFSYKPICSFDHRDTCNKHRPTYTYDKLTARPSDY